MPPSSLTENVSALMLPCFLSSTTAIWWRRLLLGCHGLQNICLKHGLLLLLGNLLLGQNPKRLGLRSSLEHPSLLMLGEGEQLLLHQSLLPLLE